MKVDIAAAAAQARIVAEQALVRIHPDMFPQYVASKVGGLKKAPPNGVLPRRKLEEWVSHYDRVFNRFPVEHELVNMEPELEAEEHFCSHKRSGND